jgi:hypothetical protein
MRRTFENFKSLVLTALIILSLVLTGSLWFDNYQGLSLIASSMYGNMINNFTNIIEEDNSIVYDKIIMPYKVTVANLDENRWLFYSTDNMNTSTWNIVRSRLDSLTPETEIITGQVREWDNLFNRKAIIFEFGGPLAHDVLKLAIPNLPKETNAFENVEKIAITKSLDGNTIYILQNNNNKKSLYKVLLKGDEDVIDYVISNCNNVKTDVKYVELAKVGTTKFYNNKEVIPGSTVLFPVFNTPSHRNTVKALKTSYHFNMEDEYSINRFTTETFKNADFAKFITNDESSIFINDDKSSIKFEKNGMMEYINNSKLSGEIVSANKNFNAAMDFINNMRLNNIYLKSASEDNGLYTFKFYMAIDGTMIGFKDPIIDNDLHTIIEVQVKEGSIRYFRGKLLDLEIQNRGVNVSNFTHNIMDNLLRDISANSKINVPLLEKVYVIDNIGTYYPSWLLKYNLKKTDPEVVSITNTVKR